MSTLRTILHPKKDKENNIFYRLTICLTVNRKRSYFHLVKNIESKYWNKEKEEVRETHTNHKLINKLLKSIKLEIVDSILELETSKKNYSAKEIMDKVKLNRKLRL